MVVWEGTRPLLVEIQALVDHSMMSNPAPRGGGAGTEPSGDPAGGAAPSRRPTDGRSGRLRQCGRRGEGHGNQRRPGAAAGDGLQPARPSSAAGSGGLWRSGLAGEIRPVPSGQERISEAAKHGFRRAIVPAANVPKKVPEGMQIFGVKKLSDALSVLTTYNKL